MRCHLMKYSGLFVYFKSLRYFPCSFFYVFSISPCSHGDHSCSTIVVATVHTIGEYSKLILQPAQSMYHDDTSLLLQPTLRLPQLLSYLNRVKVYEKHHNLKKTFNLRRSLVLTHWGWDKMAAIFHTTLSKTFSWMKMHDLRLEF